MVEAQIPAITPTGPLIQPSVSFASQVASQSSSYICGSIEGTELNILIDSGSSESFISAEFRQSIQALRQRPLTTNFIAARAVNGQLLDTLGTITVTLRVGNKPMQHVFHVLRKSTQTAILGLDFLTAQHALLDFSRGRLQLWGIEIPLLSGADLVPVCSNVSLSATLSLPPLSEILVPVNVSPFGPTDFVPEFVGYLEPNPQSKSECVVAHTLTSVKDGRTTARLLNPTNQTLTLREGTHIGEFFAVGEADLGLSPASANSTIATVIATEEPVVSLTNSPASSSQIGLLKALLVEYRDIFSSSKTVTGKCTLVKHHINTGDHPPLRQRAYRTSPEKREEIDRQVAALLADGVIEESSSPWASPVVLVRKKNGEWRFCIDYRRVNSVTVKDCHPLPRVDDTLDALSGSCWFSTLDFSNGYWQVEVAEEDRQKTAFTTGRGLYQWRSMPMGLTNSPATFQRMMELVLRGLPWQVCMVYLDDVLIFSPTFAEHMASLREVFSRIQSAGLKLNPGKCHLAQDHVVFLGHVVSRQGLQPDPRNTEKVKTWPTPQSPTEVRAFLGLCSYYRRFVRDFAHRAAPLHHLTCKDVPFMWTKDCDVSFHFLKSVLSSAPVVTMPDYTCPFKVYTDASMEAVGAVLAQDKEGLERVVVYASQSLTNAQKRWSTFDKELWAVVWAVRQFRHYIGSSPFTVITDHKPLLGLRGMAIDKDPTGKRARWILELDPYNWTMQHKEGRHHTNADALSRRPQTTTEGATVSVNVIRSSAEPPRPSGYDSPRNAVPQSPIIDTGGLHLDVLLGDSDSLALQQQSDPDIAVVLDWVKPGGFRPPRGSLRGCSKWLRKLWSEFPRLSLVNGLLCRTVQSSLVETALNQVVVPAALVPCVLRHLHGSPVAAHFSAERVWERARALCYWPSMLKDIRQWCEQCVSCQTRKSPVPKHFAPMGGLQSVRPFQRVATDILELPVTSKGNRYVLVAEDYFSKFVNLYALPNQTAQSVAQCLFEDYVLVHGIPETLHSDQGRQFEADIMQRLCVLLDIKKTRTSPYNPKSDGMVERFNRTLIDQLAKTLLSCDGEWDDYLKHVAFSYNTSVHASTGYTPYYLTHGREARVPVNVLLPELPITVPGSHSDFVSNLVEHLNVAFTNTRQNATVAHENQKLYHDCNVRHVTYAEGDLVWLHNPREDRMKLAPHWRGPFTVTGVPVTDNGFGLTYRIKDTLVEDGLEQVVHYNRLKPYTLGSLPPRSTVTSPDPTPSSPAPYEGLPAADSLQELDLVRGDPPSTMSRVGRTLRPPSRFADFVTYR